MCIHFNLQQKPQLSKNWNEFFHLFSAGLQDFYFYSNYENFAGKSRLSKAFLINYVFFSVRVCFVFITNYIQYEIKRYPSNGIKMISSTYFSLLKRKKIEICYIRGDFVILFMRIIFFMLLILIRRLND